MSALIAMVATSLVMLPVAPVANAEYMPTCRFTGGHDSQPTEWGKSENWDCGWVPGKSDHAIIDRYVTTRDWWFALGGAPIGNITLESGGDLDPYYQVVAYGDVRVKEGALLSDYSIDVKGTLYLEGGDIYDSPELSAGLTAAVLDWDGGSIAGYADVGNLTWRGGSLDGRLYADSATLTPQRWKRVYRGQLVVSGTTTFAAPQSAGDLEANLQLIQGDVDTAVQLRTEGPAEFRSNWSVSGWNEGRWRAASVRLPFPNTVVRTQDLVLAPEVIGVAPSSQLLMSGGTLRPTIGANDAISGGRAYLGCSMPGTGCENASLVEQDVVGRLETGAPAEGETAPESTEVVLPAKLAMRNIVWAHWSGAVTADPSLTSGLASVEPWNPADSSTSATNAWLEWIGGSLHGVTFPGGGAQSPAHGVDVDILGNATSGPEFGNVEIGSDALLSAEGTTIRCDRTLRILPTGTLSLIGGTSLSGCNDRTRVVNEGVIEALEGSEPAFIGETRFDSSGTLDIREASLTFADLVNAQLTGTFKVAWGNGGRIELVDRTPLRLGPVDKPLTVDVVTRDEAVEDDYFLPIYEPTQSSLVTGHVTTTGAPISPGLLWMARVDTDGLVVEARKGVTVANRLSGCQASPCRKSVSKGKAYSLSWIISPSEAVTLGVRIELPAKAKFVKATGMSCSGTATLTCSIPRISTGQSATVTLRLVSPRVGSAVVAGQVTGTNLVGPLTLQPVAVTIGK